MEQIPLPGHSPASLDLGAMAAATRPAARAGVGIVAIARNAGLDDSL